MKKAFTLAEVLITLGIIGIVAEITIPTLMQKFQEQATATELKKEYSILQSAFELAVQNTGGTPDTWNLGTDATPGAAANMLTILTPYLKITRNCGSAAGCFPTNYKILNGTAVSGAFDDTVNNGAKFQLVDGSIVRIYINSASCNDQTRGTSANLKDECGSF